METSLIAQFSLPSATILDGGGLCYAQVHFRKIMLNIICSNLVALKGHFDVIIRGVTKYMTKHVLNNSHSF